MRSGDAPNRRSLPFGTLLDIHGDPIIDAHGNVRVSNDNDFSSLIQGRGNQLYMVSHFESRPAAMYLTQLRQNPKTGELKPLRTRPLDFSDANGGWVHCAGSVTPWGNHLGSEEYPPDAKQWRDKTIDGYNAMYLAMSRVINAMTDGAGDISVPYNYCGTVYGLDLDENYFATNMYGVVSGLPRTESRGALVDNKYPEDGPYASNNCDLNAISEPDNVTFIPGYKTLIIGEDTGQHQNDLIWAYNVESQELTRVQTTPCGSETTSPYFYPDINGFSYIMSVIQHPFGESDQDALQVDEEVRGYTGYLGPFPTIKDDEFDRSSHRDWDRGDQAGRRW